MYMSKIVKKGLLIGINYEGSKYELKGCINDTENLKEFLETHKFLNNNEITAMTDSESTDGPNYPTKKNIYLRLMELVKFAHMNMTSKVFLFVTYSGHGAYFPDTDGDELDSRDEVLCPVDCDEAGYLSDDWLKTQFIDHLPSNVKLVMLVDACHSGTVLDLKYNYAVNSKGTHIVHTKCSDTKCDVVLISGSSDEQTSADSSLYDEFDRDFEFQGAMTLAFIKKYRSNISYEKLVKNMRTWLKRKKFTQIPQLSSGRYIDTMSPFLIKN